MSSSWRSGSTEMVPDHFEWRVVDILRPGAAGAYACLLLNRPLQPHQLPLFVSVWNGAARRVLVDGGADVMYRLLTGSSPSSRAVTMVGPAAAAAAAAGDVWDGGGPLALRPPHVLCGDLDSVSGAALAYFGGHTGCTVVRTVDQDLTDFSKAVLLASCNCPLPTGRAGGGRALWRHTDATRAGDTWRATETRSEFTGTTTTTTAATAAKIVVVPKSSGCGCGWSSLRCLVAVVDHGGRLDHTLANISTLARFGPGSCGSGRAAIYLLAPDSVSWLLAPGSHVIHLAPMTVAPVDDQEGSNCLDPPQPKDPADPLVGATEGPARRHCEWCSLVPVVGPVERVTTRGLKWNLTAEPMQMGRLISSSNCPLDGAISVVTSGPLLFSLHLPSVLPASSDRE